LRLKLYGDDLRTLEHKAEEVQAQMASVKRGVEDLGIFRIIGQPNLNYTVDRDAAARWGINVADIQDAVQTAVGANALYTGSAGRSSIRRDACAINQQYRDTREAIDDIRSPRSIRRARLPGPTYKSVNTDDGAEEIYREGGQRYIAIKYSVRGRDLGSTVEEAIKQA
jgi:cobalt-zinc-cadmium resistance protein CzcA